MTRLPDPDDWSDALVGGGDAGERIRSGDWSRTPLGPLRDWPVALRSVLLTCLHSQFPMALWWGPDAVLLHNDAYRTILGPVRDDALGRPGREVWPEVWPQLDAGLREVRASGRATWRTDERLVLHRSGRAEECFFTSSFSPVMADAGGAAGVLTVVTETTATVIAGRRVRLASALAAALLNAADVEDVYRIAPAVVVSERYDFAFSELYVHHDDGWRLAGGAGAAGVAPHAGPVTVASVGRVASERRPEIVDGTTAMYPVQEPGSDAATAVLVLGVDPTRPVDDAIRDFGALLAGHVGTALAAVRARAAQQAHGQVVARLDAVERMRRADRRYRSLVEASAAVVWECDADRRITVPQTSWHAYTGQAWPEQAHDGWAAMLHPDDRSRFTDGWRRAAESGQRLYEAHVRVHHADTIAYRHCVARTTPIRDDAGTVTEWIATLTDVHDRTDLILALDTERTRYERLAATDVLAVFGGVEERIEHANDAFLTMLGYTPEDLARGLRWPGLTPEGWEEADARALRQLAETGRATAYAKEYLHRDGRRVPVLIGVAALRRDPLHWLAYATDLTAERTAQRQLQRTVEQRETLLRLTEALGRAADVEQVAEAVISTVAATLGAGAASIVRHEPPDGYVLLRSTGMPQLGLESWTSRKWRQDPITAELVQTRRPVLVGSLAERDRRYPAMAGLPVDHEAWANLPLLLDDRLVGIAAFGWREPRVFADADVALLQAVAAQCSAALDRARLFDAEHRARRVAEQAQNRLSLLAEAGAIVAEATDERHLLHSLAELLAERMDARCRIDAQDTTVQVGDATDGPVLRAPLVARGTTVGTLELRRGAGRPPFAPDDTQVMNDLGRRAGAALDNLTLLAARTRVAARLQESLLPERLPLIPRAEVAVRYLAGDDHAEVGGDFYDAFALNDDEYALVIGDVSGRGVDAAGLTGLARTTLRTLGDDLSPAAALARFNKLLLSRATGERFVTAAYLRLRAGDDDGMRVTSCLAGHPPPLLVRRDGAVVPLGTPGQPLGLLADPDLGERVTTLDDGDCIVLYTDGITEAKGPDGLFGEERLTAVLREVAGRSAEAVAGHLEQTIRNYRDRGGDDSAILVLRLLAPTDPGDRLLLDLHLPADDAAVATARRAAADATADILTSGTRYDVLVAVSELVTNAVRQLHRRPTRTLRTDPVHLRLMHRWRTVRVEVLNPGLPFSVSDVPPADDLAEHGRGLVVVRALSADMGVDTSNGATCVWCELPY